MVSTHKDLVVWQLSLDLVDVVYDLTVKLPDDEKYGLSTQLKRAAVSIPANIAEGAGRKSNKEFMQFLNIARGSLSEVETHMIICQRRGWLSDADVENVDSLSRRIGSMLSKLAQSIK